MKRLTILLTLGALLLGTALASASGSIVGSVYPPSTARGMQITDSGIMWDLGAPKRTKSTVRAEIWLIKSDVNLNALPYTELKKWYQEGIIPENTPIYRAEADEKGGFAFRDVPAATYYVMILDPHGQDGSIDLTEKANRDELWKKLPHVDECKASIPLNP